MVDAARDAGVKFDEKASSARKEESNPAPAQAGKAAARNRPALPSANSPKTDFLGYKQLNANDAEVLAIVKDGAGVPSGEGRRSGRNRARPHQLLRRLRRTGRRHGLVHFDRWQHHGCRDTGCVLPGAGSPRAQGGAQAADSPWAITSTPSSMGSAATTSSATTPARTCCTPRCARCWARM